jgi:hypothetical protein
METVVFIEMIKQLNPKVTEVKRNAEKVWICGGEIGIMRNTVLCKFSSFVVAEIITIEIL